MELKKLKGIKPNLIMKGLSVLEGKKDIKNIFTNHLTKVKQYIEENLITIIKERKSLWK
jgi:hypothetical protein